MERTFDTIISKVTISMKKYKSAELRSSPKDPTETKIKYLLKTLSITLKLYFLFKIKLVVIPIVILKTLAIK